MTSAQPPSNGDRPAAGQEPATPEAATPEATASDAATPSTPRATPKRTTARRTPAARKQGDFEAPAKRTPSTRKRSTATSISPNGEAPEILDAMLGKSAPAPAADTSTSPAEPVATEPVPAETVPPEAAADLPASAEPGPAAPAGSAEPESTEPESTPEPPETATAVLPSAADFYREPTMETEILNPTAAADAEQHPAEHAEAAARGTASEGTAPDAVTPPVAEPVTPAADGSTPAPDAAGAERIDSGTRPARSVNELADRLDDSRFFSSLFDFTFTSYVTRKLAGPVYVVGLVLIGLGIVVGFANSLGIAIAASSPGGAFIFLLGVLVTLVAAILSVLLLRVTIEVFCAIIEIAQNTRRRRPPRD
jgi:hypothetical protein